MAQALLLKAPEPDKPRTANEAKTHMNGRQGLTRVSCSECRVSHASTCSKEAKQDTHTQSVWPLGPNFYSQLGRGECSITPGFGPPDACRALPGMAETKPLVLCCQSVESCPCAGQSSSKLPAHYCSDWLCVAICIK